MPGSHPGRGRAALAALMLPAGTLAVHQLRYLAVYGHHFGHALSDDGDAYAASLLPWLVALGAVGLGTLLVALVRRTATPTGSRKRRLIVLWAIAAGLLLAGYVAQEGLEVTVGDGHGTLLAHAFAGGGWFAVPLAIAVGLAWAALLGGLERIVATLLHRSPRPAASPRAAAICRPPLPDAGPLPSPLARNRAGRAPPLTAALS